ncbi:MAG: hypothetical protein ACRELC_04695, partial [Gemmatimonadota bacterium]
MGSETPPETTGPEAPLALLSPDARVPRAPGRLADRLAQTTRALRAAIDAWRDSGATDEWPPPREIVLLA